MRHRLVGWLSHRQHEIGIVGWIIWAVGFTAGNAVDGLKMGATSWAAMIFYAPVSALAWFAMHRHRSRLCDRCIAEWPLDGPQRVTPIPPNSPHYSPRRARAVRWRLRALHLHHLGLWVLGAFFVLLVGSAFAARWWLPLAAIGTAAAAVPVITHEVASLIHRPLEMWCPWCRRRDDGDDDQERDPEPDPAGTVTA